MFRGDHALRSGYSRCMLQLMDQMEVSSDRVQDVVDLGCATGLSTLALQEIFPQARFTGVDLSPHFLAVGRYNQQQREVSGGPELLGACKAPCVVLGRLAGVMGVGAADKTRFGPPLQIASGLNSAMMNYYTSWH